jgi:hypothetical protein
MQTSNDSTLPETTPGDIDLITQASQDYIERWYSGDADRMRRCLHPELVKRTIMYDPKQGIWLLRRPTTTPMMVESTREGGGSEIPEAERTYEIIVQDAFRHIACVKVVSRYDGLSPPRKTERPLVHRQRALGTAGRRNRS